MLEQLVKIEPVLIQMAKSIDYNTYDEILQETYIKLYDSKKKFEDIDTGYIYFTMRSVFIDSVRKQKNIVLIDDFSHLKEIETDYIEIKINKSNLNLFEKTLIDAHYGKNITTDKNIIIAENKGLSLLKLSEKTNIPYRTLYTTLQKIKIKLCKDLEMQ